MSSWQSQERLLVTVIVVSDNRPFSRQSTFIGPGVGFHPLQHSYAMIPSTQAPGNTFTGMYMYVMVLEHIKLVFGAYFDELVILQSVH